MISKALGNLSKSMVFEAKCEVAQRLFDGQRVVGDLACKLVSQAGTMRSSGVQSFGKSAKDLSSAVKESVMKKAVEAKNLLENPGKKMLNSMPSERTVMEGLEKALNTAKKNGKTTVIFGAGVLGVGGLAKFSLQTAEEIKKIVKEGGNTDFKIESSEEKSETVVNEPVKLESNQGDSTLQDYLVCVKQVEESAKSKENPMKTDEGSSKEEKGLGDDLKLDSPPYSMINDPRAVYVASAVVGVATMALGLFAALSRR